MNVLFWNVRQRDLSQLVAELAAEHKADLAVIAEPSGINPVELLRLLSSQCGKSYHAHLFPGQEHLHYYSRYPSSHFLILEDNRGISARVVKPTDCLPLNMIAVHSPSQMYWNSVGDRIFLAAQIREMLERIEHQQGHKRSMIVGDFNVDPFDEALVNSEGLHAVPDRKIASRKSRKVNGNERFYLYNPMWSLLGDLSDGPAGSYYYRKPTTSCRFWHLFDQVLLRPELAATFKSEQFRIATSIGKIQLVTKNHVPKKNEFSDHLPILFSLDVQGHFLDV